MKRTKNKANNAKPVIKKIMPKSGISFPRAKLETTEKPPYIVNTEASTRCKRTKYCLLILK